MEFLKKIWKGFVYWTFGDCPNMAGRSNQSSTYSTNRESTVEIDQQVKIEDAVADDALVLEPQIEENQVSQEPVENLPPIEELEQQAKVEKVVVDAPVVELQPDSVEEGQQNKKADDIIALLETKLDEQNQTIAQLTSLVQKKFENDSLIQKLFDDIQNYKDRDLELAKAPIYNSVIEMYDFLNSPYLREFSSVSKDGAENFGKNIRYMISKLLHDLNLCGVDYLCPREGDVYDKKKYTIVDVVSCTDEGKSQRVYRCRKAGFYNRTARLLLRPAEVDIFN